MKPEKNKSTAEDDPEVLEITLERIPVENLAEVTDTLDRVRISARKLIAKIAEQTDLFDRGETNSNQLEARTASIGKALTILNQGMKIVLSAAAAKQKLNSGE